MHLEESTEAREQKPHRWSIGDPSESNGHGDEGGYQNEKIDEMRKAGGGVGGTWGDA